MMDKGPKIRIVGGASEVGKEQVRQTIKSNLFDHFSSLSDEQKKRIRRVGIQKNFIRN